MKKLNKWIAGLLCMMLVITMVAGLGVTEVKADDAVTTVSSWNELKNAISKGGNIQLDKNITAGTGDYRFNVDKNVTIDLNGYTIDRNLNEQQDNVFSVIAGGTLIIKDTSEGQNGKITGGWANEDYAGGINVREGTLILESGNIVGNRSNKTFTKRGGGVAVFYNGTFIMRGGKISGNEAGYGAGVVVLDNCNFEMTGGEITDNICDFGEYQDQEGAGVFAYQGADVTIGGSANIYGNKNSKDENSNLYIYRYKSSEKINLSTTVPLTTGAKIGVGYYQPYGKNEIPLADSGKQFKDAFFTDDDKNYEITTKYAEELVKKMEKSGAKAYLVNTGWNGTGKRISIKDTRGIIDAILSGAILNAPTKTIPYFNFEVPTELPGVDAGILDPRDTYADAAQWEEKAKDLAARFVKNFAKYEGNAAGKALVAAGPQA